MTRRRRPLLGANPFICRLFVFVRHDSRVDDRLGLFRVCRERDIHSEAVEYASLSSVRVEADDLIALWLVYEDAVAEGLFSCLVVADLGDDILLHLCGSFCFHRYFLYYIPSWPRLDSLCFCLILRSYSSIDILNLLLHTSFFICQYGAMMDPSRTNTISKNMSLRLTVGSASQMASLIISQSGFIS